MRVLSSYSELTLLASLNGVGVEEYFRSLTYNDMFLNVFRATPGPTMLLCVLRPDGTFEFFKPDGTPAEVPETIGHMGGYLVNLAMWEMGCRCVTIPCGVTRIGYDSFSGCSALTGVVIPDSVTEIGKFAFSGCYSLLDVPIPDSVKTIGESAFYACQSLTNVTIPDSVTSIGAFAFCRCSDLARVSIPASVTYIGEGAFAECNYIKVTTREKPSAPV